MADPPLHSPITPHFFKPLLPGFTDHLDIPRAFFSNHLKGISSNNGDSAKLKSDASEITWEVKINGRRLCDGWKDFAVAHDLRLGDIVVFRHEGDMMFHVTPFGPSCCEIQYAPFCTNDNEDDNTDNVKTETFSSNKNSSKTKSLSDHSRFVSHVTAPNLSRDTRGLPKSFTIPNGVSKNCKDVILVNEEGKTWNLDLKYKNSSGEFYMRRGWRSFCEDNGKKAGDFFTFEMVQNGKRGTPLVLQFCLLNSGNQDKFVDRSTMVRTQSVARHLPTIVSESESRSVAANASHSAYLDEEEIVEELELISESIQEQEKNIELMQPLEETAEEVEDNIEPMQTLEDTTDEEEVEGADKEEAEKADKEEAEKADEEENIQLMQPLEFFVISTDYVKSTKMQTRCDTLKVVDFLKMRLTTKELKWFTEHNQFKHIFHMVCHRTRKVMGMWMLLLHTIRTEKHKQCWFVVNGVPIRYSIREHALLSGLCCRQYPKQYLEMGSLSFVKKYFGGKNRVPKVQVKDVLETLEKMEDAGIDRLKMAVLYFLSTVIKGKKKMVGGNIEEFILRVVDDLDVCETFPWGRFTFDDCITNISCMMNLMGGTVKETSVFPGFILPLEILAFECIPALKKKFRENIEDADNECPRMCKGKFKETSTIGFSLNQIYDTLGSTKDICSILIPEGEEEILLARLVEDRVDEMDVIDIIVDGWNNALTKTGEKIWWEDLYNSDIQSRLPKLPVLEPIVEPLSVPESYLHGLAQLEKKMLKAMEERFRVVNTKIDLIDLGLKEQNNWRRGSFGHRYDENNEMSETLVGRGEKVQGETVALNVAMDEVAVDEVDKTFKEGGQEVDKRNESNTPKVIIQSEQGNHSRCKRKKKSHNI